MWLVEQPQPRAPRATSTASDARRCWPASTVPRNGRERPAKPNCRAQGGSCDSALAARTANLRFSSTVSSSYRNDWGRACQPRAGQHADRPRRFPAEHGRRTRVHRQQPGEDLSMLVLPAPFGPRRCTTSPSPTSKQAPARRGKPAGERYGSWRRTAGGMKIAHVRGSRHPGHAGGRRRARSRSHRSRQPHPAPRHEAAGRPRSRKPGGAGRPRSASTIISIRSRTRRVSSSRASRAPWLALPTRKSTSAGRLNRSSM